MTDTGGLVASAVNEASVVAKAAQRVAAMALVDASISLPACRPVCDAALGAMRLRASNGAPLQTYRPSTRPQTALLILCHPVEGASLCRSLADVWEKELQEANVQSTRVELCGDVNLGPRCGTELRAALSAKENSTPQVQHLQKLVEESQFLIFVHPIYWFEVPSQLKGFLEGVLTVGFAYCKLPSCWTLNKAVGVLNRLPVVPSLLRRYSAYGMLRDKQIYITRTQGGPRAGLGIFGHEATSLESAMQFCGAHITAVDTVAEVDDTSAQCMADTVLPGIQKKVEAHCRAMGAARAQCSSAPLFPSLECIEDKQ